MTLPANTAPGDDLNFGACNSTSSLSEMTTSE